MTFEECQSWLPSPSVARVVAQGLEPHLGGGGVETRSRADALMAFDRVSLSTVHRFNPNIFAQEHTPSSRSRTDTIFYTNRHSTMTVSQDPPAAAPPATTAAASQPRHEEYQYLDLVREILDQGELRQDRYLHPPLSCILAH